VIPLTDFSENQSHPCFYYNYWQLHKVSCISINKCRRYPGDNILWHTDGLTDGSKTLYPHNFVAWGINIFLKIVTYKNHTLNSRQELRKQQIKGLYTTSLAYVILTKTYWSLFSLCIFTYKTLISYCALTIPNRAMIFANMNMYSTISESCYVHLNLSGLIVLEIKIFKDFSYIITCKISFCLPFTLEAWFQQTLMRNRPSMAK
jgi:hypothetical protein